MNYTDEDVKRQVKGLCDAAMGDSDVKMDPTRVEEALRKDLEFNKGRLLGEVELDKYDGFSELDTFVCGEYDELMAIAKHYPNLQKLMDEYWE